MVTSNLDNRVHTKGYLSMRLKRPCHSQASRGFTLIELLVAMFITAIIGAIAASGFSTAIRAIDSVERKAERLMQLNNFFLRFERDIQQLVPRVQTTNINTQPAFSYTQNGPRSAFSFTNRARINPAPEIFQRSELQRISYQFEDNIIVRQRLSQSDPENTDAIKEQALLQDVKSLSLRFVAPIVAQNNNPNARANQFQTAKLLWINKWPDPARVLAAQNNQQSNLSNALAQDLPVAIELSVDVEPWGVITRVFEVVDGPI